MNISVSGIQTYYDQFGNTNMPVLLFIHGWGGTHESLSALAYNLQDSFRCYLIDLPGFGKTANPPPTWGVPEYTKFVNDLLISLHLDNVFVFGHSFGGAIALNLVANYPSKINKLIVCAPSWHRQNIVKNNQSSRLRSYPLLRKIYYWLFYPDSDLVKYPRLEDNFKLIVSQDLTEVVQKVKLPTLILWGDRDTYVPSSDGQLLHRYIPSSSIHIFADIGHNLPIKFPKLIITPIRTFLTTNDA